MTENNNSFSDALAVQWFPGHMAKTVRMINENLKLCDLVLEIRDARIPESSKNPEIARLLKDKPKIVMLNKSDCADLEIDNKKVVEDVSKDMFTHEPDIAPYHHCKNMNIYCETKNCIFNKSGECYSNGIFVGSEKVKAPCNSYVPR